MTEFITIDGGEGEGGGQMLRSALALGLHTGRPFRIENIRKNRDKPGLLRQHLAGVKLAARIGAAEVEGAELGSETLSFRPQALLSGTHEAAVGGAGSAMLVIQTVLPALLLAEGSTTLVVEGGTHNMSAPTFEHMTRVLVPQLRKMGARLHLTLERHGFFPAGGGRVRLEVEPVAKLGALELESRGKRIEQSAQVLVARLRSSVARRELERVERRMKWTKNEVIEVEDSSGPGNVIQLVADHDEVAELVTGFGRRQKSSESVADEAIDQMRAYQAHEAPVGRHLSDQLMLPMALAGAGSFLSAEPTQHALTNMTIIEKFLDLPMSYEPIDERHWRFRVGG